MTFPLDELKPGDTILVEATVTQRKMQDGSVIVRHKSRNEFLVYRDIDVESVVKFALKVGDRVQWFEDGEWQRGTVLGLEEDQEQTAKEQGRVWAWVRDDIKWPRRTFDVKDLKRA